MTASRQKISQGVRLWDAMRMSIAASIFGGVAAFVAFIAVAAIVVNYDGQGPIVDQDFILVAFNIVPLAIVTSIVSFAVQYLPRHVSSIGYAMLVLMLIFSFLLGSLLPQGEVAIEAYDYAYLVGALACCAGLFAFHWLFFLIFARPGHGSGLRMERA